MIGLKKSIVVDATRWYGRGENWNLPGSGLISGQEIVRPSLTTYSTHCFFIFHHTVFSSETPLI